MTDSNLLFEFIVVIVEIGDFMLNLSVGAIVLKVIIPRLISFAKRVKLSSLKKQCHISGE